MAKTLEEYLALPYTIVLRRDIRDEIFVARVEELPGCSAHGNTEVEALSNLRDNMGLWISDCLESGDAVPEPSEDVELPSGKWLQRVPRTLHLKIIRLAKNEGVSLNQFVTAVLAEAVGEQVTQQKSARAASVAAIRDVDPWFGFEQADKCGWESFYRVNFDRILLRSLAKKIPGFEESLIEKGYKSDDEETHPNWSARPLELARR